MSHKQQTYSFDVFCSWCIHHITLRTNLLEMNHALCFVVKRFEAYWHGYRIHGYVVLEGSSKLPLCQVMIQDTLRWKPCSLETRPSRTIQWPRVPDARWHWQVISELKQAIDSSQRNSNDLHFKIFTSVQEAWIKVMLMRDYSMQYDTWLYESLHDNLLQGIYRTSNQVHYNVCFEVRVFPTFWKGDLSCPSWLMMWHVEPDQTYSSIPGPTATKIHVSTTFRCILEERFRFAALLHVKFRFDKSRISFSRDTSLRLGPEIWRGWHGLTIKDAKCKVPVLWLMSPFPLP